ncbi:protein YgfX [Uliginosibacterium flavum]|uniref:Protein YgfX n=1 Tax=Uliginosibacterium flavum TaxID=1396831 RepID=A0ABV2TPI5_9RHOO
MSAPLSFSLRISVSLAFMVVLAHLLPGLCVWSPNVSVWLRGVMLGVLACSAGWQYWRIRRLRGVRLEWMVSGEAWLQTPRGRLQIEVLADSLDFDWLLVLHWRELESSREGRAALTRDAFSAEHWRVLRRRLRWSLAQEDSPGRR